MFSGITRVLQLAEVAIYSFFLSNIFVHTFLYQPKKKSIYMSKVRHTNKIWVAGSPVDTQETGGDQGREFPWQIILWGYFDGGRREQKAQG